MPSSRRGETLPVAINAANICRDDACIVPRTGRATSFAARQQAHNVRPYGIG